MATLTLTKNKLATLNKTQEYYNALTANIQLSGPDLKAIMLTSVQPNEGKSTTSVGVAVAFAKSGYKTVLVDADTRNSVMSGVFRSEGKVIGLTSYLTGRAEITDVLCETNVPNLTVIEAGQVPPNPTRLLQSTHFTSLLEVLRIHYDYIIIDTPPVGLVVDSVYIAQECDGTVLITASGATKRKAVQKAKYQLEQTGTQFLGVVLNKYDVKLDRYGAYGNYGEYGNYGNYGRSQKKAGKLSKRLFSAK